MDLINYLFIAFGALALLAIAFAMFLPARNSLKHSDAEHERTTPSRTKKCEGVLLEEHVEDKASLL